MSGKKIPDAIIREPEDGVITYEQNPYVWARNSGQMIYQDTIRVGLPTRLTGKEAPAPALSVSSGNAYVDSTDPTLVNRMRNILREVNADGVVDANEMRELNKIIRDASDDGALNGSVPNLLIDKPAK